MAKLKLPSFDGGSLLQKTLLYVVTFVLGSAGFVAIASLVVVSVAKAVIPARNVTESSASATDKAADVAPNAPGKTTGRRGRGNRAKAAAVDVDVVPAAEEIH